MATKKAPAAAITMSSDNRWQAEEDLRTLARAKEIEADRKRLMAAQKMGAAKIKEMQSVVAKKPAAPMRKR
jgi:hypothetical protein